MFQLEGELEQARKAAGLPPAPAQPLDNVQIPVVKATPEPVRAVLNGDGESQHFLIFCVSFCSGTILFFVSHIIYFP